MEVITSKFQLEKWRKSISGSLGFVPTMGALHFGHGSLIERSKNDNPNSLVSIFVNPTQFAPTEDFNSYPREAEKDFNYCRELGVSAVYHPQPADIYPHGARTTINPFRTSNYERCLCDKDRPDFFSGVLTVVNILFNQIQPNRAYFGLKDAQQFAYIRQMTLDLSLNVEAIPCPIIREQADDLAMSSRNVYLSQEERVLAGKIPSGLKEIVNGEKCEIIKNKFEKLGVIVQYLEIRSFPDLILRDHSDRRRGDRVFFAGKVGNTRLIDNWEIKV